MLRIEEIREIIKLIDESSIHKFTYETDGGKIKLQKKVENISVVAEPKIIETSSQPKNELPIHVESGSEELTVEPSQAQVPAGGSVDYDHEIVSPMVGTIYSSPSPDHDPFVKKGMMVSEGSVVCIIEAMKLFNEIESEVSGEIVEVLVKDGELVEFGQPLYRVKIK